MEWEALAALEGIHHDQGMGTEGPEGGSESAANGDLDEWSAIFFICRALRCVAAMRTSKTLYAVALVAGGRPTACSAPRSTTSSPRSGPARGGQAALLRVLHSKLLLYGHAACLTRAPNGGFRPGQIFDSGTRFDGRGSKMEAQLVAAVNGASCTPFATRRGPALGHASSWVGQLSFKAGWAI
jgi:hypothetical protein